MMVELMVLQEVLEVELEQQLELVDLEELEIGK
jgi:hypothetical protein